MRVKLLEGLPPFKKKEKEKVYVALKGEVCVRTDLVRSVTTDVTKQAVGSGTGTAVFNQYSRWGKKQQSHSFPLVLPLSLACALSLLSASHRP